MRQRGSRHSGRPWRNVDEHHDPAVRALPDPVRLLVLLLTTARGASVPLACFSSSDDAHSFLLQLVAVHLGCATEFSLINSDSMASALHFAFISCLTIERLRCEKKIGCAGPGAHPSQLPLELEFESEELRQKWIAPAGHQRVWPPVERTMTTLKNYPVVLYRRGVIGRVGFTGASVVSHR